MIQTALKIRKLGIGNTVRGFITKTKYKALRKKYSFDLWHITPLELRRYAVGISALLGNQIREGDVVVDIGCGLGDLLRRVYDKASVRAEYYGFDVSGEAIAAAKHISQKRNIHFSVGSFAEAAGQVNGQIDWLVAVNFLHGANPETASDCFREILSVNPVRNIIVDIVPHNGIEHDFSEILPREYHLEYTSEPYEGGRLIQVFSIVANGSERSADESPSPL
jgi:SAM-dependent methyltransferase